MPQNEKFPVEVEIIKFLISKGADTNVTGGRDDLPPLKITQFKTIAEILI